MTSRLKRNEYAWGHGYTMLINGKWKRVPGVTTITGVMDKGGLTNAAAREVATWAATHAGEYGTTTDPAEWLELAKGAHRRVWDVARDNGTRLHLIAQRLIYGDPVPAEDDHGVPFSDDVVRMGQQVARFMDAWDVTPLLVEASVFHAEHHWAGTMDLQAILRGGVTWGLDYKTSAAGIYPDTAIQVGAYGRATHVQLEGVDRPMIPPDRYGALWVRPDHCELVPLTVTDDTYRVFRALQFVYEWNKQPRDAVVGDPLEPEEAVA